MTLSPLPLYFSLSFSSPERKREGERNEEKKENAILENGVKSMVWDWQNLYSHKFSTIDRFVSLSPSLSPSPFHLLVISDVKILEKKIPIFRF